MDRDDQSRREERRRRRREMVRATDLSTVGLVFPVAAVIGWFAGRTIGAWLGSPETGGLVGLLVGVASGFYNLVKVALALRDQDSGGLRRPEEGEGESRPGRPEKDGR